MSGSLAFINSRWQRVLAFFIVFLYIQCYFWSKLHVALDNAGLQLLTASVVAFVVHIVTLGMAQLAAQIYVVVVIVTSTASLVTESAVTIQGCLNGGASDRKTSHLLIPFGPGKDWKRLSWDGQLTSSSSDWRTEIGLGDFPQKLSKEIRGQRRVKTPILGWIWAPRSWRVCLIGIWFHIGGITMIYGGWTLILRGRWFNLIRWTYLLLVTSRTSHSTRLILTPWLHPRNPYLQISSIMGVVALNLYEIGGFI